jgi:hypothetical protein
MNVCTDCCKKAAAAFIEAITNSPINKQSLITVAVGHFENMLTTSFSNS